VHTRSTVHRHSTSLQLNIARTLTLISNSTIFTSAAATAVVVIALANTVHQNRAINDLEQSAHSNRQRQDDVQRVAAAHARGADAHDDEPYDDRGDEMKCRLQLVRGCEADFDEDEKQADACEADYDAVTCAVGVSVEECVSACNVEGL
jgi:hypothetical protein